MGNTAATGNNSLAKDTSAGDYSGKENYSVQNFHKAKLTSLEGYHTLHQESRVSYGIY